jgi:hypothetical protein
MHEMAKRKAGAGPNLLNAKYFRKQQVLVSGENVVSHSVLSLSILGVVKEMGMGFTKISER